MSNIEVKELYKIAIETRNLEIKLFWQRSNYFLVLNTAIAVGTFSKISTDFQIPFTVFGIFISCLWVFVNIGSKYWQVRWEYEVARLEKEISQEIRLFSANKYMTKMAVKQSLLDNNGEKKRLGLYNCLVLKKPSVSKMMTFLSASFVIFWMGILLYVIFN
ncbi:MAG: hypothetical protein AAF378_20035 [Cyanobacteria bacterium P01_A01_bin.84]